MLCLLCQLSPEVTQMKLKRHFNSLCLTLLVYNEEYCLLLLNDY